MLRITSSLFIFVICAAAAQTSTATKPNIVIILIDDMGMNDVSFHGSNQILTPNIDALAYNGILLNKHYVPNLCTPSRASLLTGKYPIHTGMQHYVIIPDEPWGLPLTERVMPEIFRDAGYSTNLIGKWHLGFWRKQLTPTFRGFDHFYGYYNGYIDYFDQTHFLLNRNYTEGVDFRRDLLPWRGMNGTYTTDIFTTEAQRVIWEHDESKPLFLIMSHLAVHTANEDDPMQALPDEVAKFSHIKDEKRRTYAGMISSLDKSVGQTVRALADKGILNNTIILLYSDNGAPTQGIHSNSGSNHPFRGQKESPWEGGIRSAGAIWSPLIQQRSYVSNQVMHSIDWLPTLASAAGIKLPSELKLDGIDMWQQLSEHKAPIPRRLLHALDDIFGYQSYTSVDLKYINGTTFDGWYDGWLGDLPVDEDDPLTPFYVQQVLSSEVQTVLGSNQLSNERITLMRTEATHTCPPNSEDYHLEIYRCEPLKAPCIFNITSDPCERYNLAKLDQLQVKLLEQEVKKFRLGAVKSARVPIPDPRADPALHNGYWQWWDELQSGSSAASLQLSALLFVVVSFFIMVHFKT